MKLITIIFFSIFIFVDCLSAQESKGFTTSLTVNDCLTVNSGLIALDGYQTLDANKQRITLPYDFGNVALRRIIQRNIAAIAAVQQDQLQLQKDIFKEVAKGSTKIEPDTPKYEEYTRQVEKSLKLPCTAKLEHININDLKLDKNEIPGTVLVALDKILDK